MMHKWWNPGRLPWNFATRWLTSALINFLLGQIYDSYIAKRFLGPFRAYTLLGKFATTFLIVFLGALSWVPFDTTTLYTWIVILPQRLQLDLLFILCIVIWRSSLNLRAWRNKLWRGLTVEFCIAAWDKLRFYLKIWILKFSAKPCWRLLNKTRNTFLKNCFFLRQAC